MTAADAVKSAYELGSKKSVMEASEYLRQAILNAFNNSKELPWPPTAGDLGNFPPLPPKLTSFLEYVILGSNTADCSEHKKRIIMSFGQDIYQGVSHGKWMLSKHILLANNSSLVPWYEACDNHQSTGSL